MMRRAGEEWGSFRTARVGHLLGYLCAHRHQAVSREHLAGLFWPESTDRQARQNLRSIVYYLRQALEPTDADSGQILITDRSTLQFRPDAACWVDVVQFEDELAQAERQSGDASAQCLGNAVELYRQDFLADCYDDWCLRERDRLRQRYAQALQKLIRYHVERGEDSEAVRYAEVALAVDPLDESLQRQLIALQYRIGGRTPALQQYRECQRTLREELDVEPEPATTDIAKLIDSDASADDVAEAAGLAKARSPSTLPQQLSSFVGRESEIESVKRALAKSRLLTLTGIGGVGKTRLAREVAATLRNAYADGVWWVNLEDLSDATLVPDAIAAVLGLRQPSGQPPERPLSDALQGKHLLLILDNVEHLIDESAGMIERLLHAVPELRVLATSREPLGIPGESHWDVPPMELPDPEDLPAVDQLLAYDAIRLFCERARMTVPEFELNDANACPVVQICRHLDGIPLSIELAAARTQALSLDEIRQRLDDRFRLLSGSDRTVIPRHRTLRATMDWSHDLLSEDERTLLRRLAIFSGAFTLDAIEAVCVDDVLPSNEILELLARLVSKSLVVVERDERGWYHLLGTVKQYELEKLCECEDPISLRDRHLAYYVSLAEEAEEALKGDQQRPWLRLLERQFDNVRAALQWTLSAHRDEPGMRLLGAIWRFWDMLGGFNEGRRWTDQALRTLDGAQTDDRARVLNAAGILAFRQGDLTTARMRHQECLALQHERDDRIGIAMSLNNLGMVLRTQGEYARALRLHEESLDIRRQLGERWDVAMTIINVGNVHYAQGNYEKARQRHREALRILRELGDAWGIAIALGYQGLAAYAQADYVNARELLQESLTLRQGLNDRHGIAGALNSLANVTLAEGKVDDAARMLERSVRMFKDLGDQEGLADGLDGFARIAFEKASLVLAAQLFAKEEDLRDAIGAPRVSLWTSAIVDYDHYIVQLRKTLGNAAFHEAWQRGTDLTLSQALDRALSAAIASG